MINITNYSLEIVPNNCLIHAERAYTILPTFFKGSIIHQYHGWPQRSIAEIIKRSANDTNIIPSVYALTNREKGMFRHISNFDKIVHHVQTTYKHDFSIYPNSFSNLKETAQKFSILKWLFIVVGSGTMNTVFMREGSVICMPSTEWLDKPTFTTLVNAKLKVIAFIDYPWRHHQRAPKSLNLNNTFRMINLSLSLID